MLVSKLKSAIIHTLFQWEMMAEINLTQAEADSLFAMEKISTEAREWDMPDLGGGVSVPLISPDKKEQFVLDISKGRIDLKRQKYQNRAREVVVLARLDLGSPHRNPDGQEVGVPHMHLYREGYGDKWASVLPDGVFSNLDDSWQVLSDFMKYCNVTRAPNFKRGLFS
jgi:hypothetical protein